ncbi:MAG TPA: GspH/FimT family pseudopilin [Thermoanaerobaculia bacterium]|jgi:type II secretory pathway pseudopilin PulG|nr:GspH/FimT family pseudopilin [Thermoanaerobaculia bacterium]
MNGERGFQVTDLIVALAVFGLTAVLGVPQLLRITADLRVRLAAEEVIGALRQARSLAVRANAEVALRFATGERGEVTFTLYRDGDHDGVTNADIRTGVDPQIAPPGRLEHVGGEVRIGLPARPVRDPGDPGQLLGNAGDPIRFNRSDLASFSPLGTSTPGSVYLTDGGSHLAVVRVFGGTGRVRLLLYDFASETWH